MNRIIPTAAALGLALSLLTACSPDTCDNAAGTHPVAVAQVAPEQPTAGKGGGRGSGSRSSGSKPKPSKPKPHHGSTTGGHSHHDYDDCDDD